jgi:glycosyltransferase involved in cell wall biosynthesis
MARGMTRRPPIRVHALIDSLTRGGAEMLLADLAAGAAAADIRFSVGYLSDEDGSPAAVRLRERGVEPVLVPVSGLVKPSAFRDVRRHLADVRPDLLHTHLGYSDAIGGAAARSLRIPTVSSIHLMAWESDLRERARLRLMAAVRRRCAARVITVSEAARRAFLEAGWDAPERVTTIHSGIAAEARVGAGAQVRESLGLGRDDTVVAMVSVVRPGKGHDLAIRALEALSDRHPSLRLLIVGEGPAGADVERLAAPLGDRVVMTGHRDEVMDVLDACDLVVHPSSRDAFPIALLEAMAAGVPSIATAVGGIPEMIEPGRTGLLIEAPPRWEQLAEALELLLREPERRRSLGAAARDRFEREFTAERWAARLRAVYDEAVAG